MSIFILNDLPFEINKELARAIGVNEAFVIQQHCYGLAKNEKWLCYSYAEWNEAFPWLSESLVKSTYKSLKQQNLIKQAPKRPNTIGRQKRLVINHEQFAIIGIGLNDLLK